MQSVPQPQPVPQVSSTPSNGQQPAQSLSAIPLPQGQQPFIVQLLPQPDKNKTLTEKILQIFQVIGALAVPFTLIWGIVQFNLQQQSDASSALDKQQQTTLDTYLDRMSDLLFTQHLSTANLDDEVRNVARARTSAALQNLNPARKRILLRFLYDTNLLNWHNFSITPNAKVPPDIRLDYDDLRGIDLSGTFMDNADLHDTFLDNARLNNSVLIYDNLSISSMHNVDLSNSSLHGSSLAGTDLTGANLSDTLLNCDEIAVYSKAIDYKALEVCPMLQGVNFTGATMKHTRLQGADLSSVNLTHANLSGAFLNCVTIDGTLHCTNLRGANLQGVDLTGANLTGAHLERADLSSTDITQRQVDQAITCKDTQTPPGITHSQALCP